MKTIDLRSDTVTEPTPEMREAMAKAVVGDDVYGEDPTVNQLQADAAGMFGKEAALFVSSGTQGNLVSLLAHCQRGDAVIMGDTSHIFLKEVGGMSAVGGIMPHPVPVQADGTMKLQDIENAIQANNSHYPRTTLICIEDTQNSAGGVAITKNYIDQLGELAHSYNLKLHIDGARIFNAATALNTDVKELTASADSLTFCLSKGLCAPVGSIVVGSQEFIDKTHQIRKLIGGAMRQVGVLAAAGDIALHKMSQRLQEDHDNAALLAEGLSEIPGITVLGCKTNFVNIYLSENAKLSPEQFVQQLRDGYNIVIKPQSDNKRNFRLVLHYWISRERTNHVIQAMKTLLI